MLGFFLILIFFSRSTPKIDRSSAETMSVTVGNVTVVITDYKPKQDKKTSSSSADLHHHVTSDSSNCSVLSGINRHTDDFVGNGGNHWCWFFSLYHRSRERKENYKNVEFLKLQEIFILTKKDDTYHNRMKAPDVHLLHT